MRWRYLRGPPALDPRDPAVLAEREQGAVQLERLERHLGHAVALLVAAGEQGVLGQRIGLRHRELFLDENTDDALLGRIEHGRPTIAAAPVDAEADHRDTRVLAMRKCRPERPVLVTLAALGLLVAAACSTDRTTVRAEPAAAPATRESRTGVPILMDLPLIGTLFGSRTVTR